MIELHPPSHRRTLADRHRRATPRSNRSRPRPESSAGYGDQEAALAGIGSAAVNSLARRRCRRLQPRFPPAPGVTAPERFRRRPCSRRHRPPCRRSHPGSRQPRPCHRSPSLLQPATLAMLPTSANRGIRYFEVFICCSPCSMQRMRRRNALPPKSWRYPAHGIGAARFTKPLVEIRHHLIAIAGRSLLLNERLGAVGVGGVALQAGKVGSAK